MFEARAGEPQRLGVVVKMERGIGLAQRADDDGENG